MCGKLLFKRERCKLPVIANQSADWCGNPPVEWSQVTITTKNRGNSQFYWYFSVHFPSNRGIATPVCALARNDRIFLVRTRKHQFIVSWSGLVDELAAADGGDAFAEYLPAVEGGGFSHGKEILGVDGICLI